MDRGRHREDRLLNETSRLKGTGDSNIPRSVATEGAATRRGRFAVGAATRAVAGDDCCGDVCAWWEREGRLYLCLADGLGHGSFAREAALAAVTSAREHPLAELPAVLAQCDLDIRATRGAAMGIAVIEPAVRTVRFCGVGNIRALLLGQAQRRFNCGYGIVGAGFRNLIVETASFAVGDTLIMASDGIVEHFAAPDERPPGPSWNAPRLAEAILERWAVATDDVAVLVCRMLS